MKILKQCVLPFASMALLFACAQRPSPTSALEAQSQQAETVQPLSEIERIVDLESSYAEQSTLAEKVSADKSALEATANALTEQVQSMSKQMESESLPDLQKAEVQAQIEAMLKEKVAVEANISSLTATDAAAKKELEALKAEIEKLKKDLAASKTATPAAKTAATHYKFTYTGQKCLDVQASGTADNVPILGFACNANSLNQQFVYDVRGAYFFLKSRVSNKCVSVTGTAVSSPVVQKACTFNSDKSWQWFGVAGTKGKLRNQYSGKCLGVNNLGRMVLSECNSIYAINFSYFKI
ncbi:MAG TPA: ricin-type beta-trefoil lectin domain protein [Oligoflexus sp.]|uniref:RICIN domain-containing protein n=1 Tax=Oligoflexus sp. TaxID=1971216 RepID=UPI002D44699B|nr:ricin-type beta-trefoil lectin domain protein [Oligoflexus sp.]HYX38110.1 ricin-type beta-trefoil lectin domain protein [Oligoflexus sp.]